MDRTRNPSQLRACDARRRDIAYESITRVLKARWTRRPHAIEIHIRRPAGGPMPGGHEHLVWELQQGGQTIRRTSSRPEVNAPRQMYVYRRLPHPPSGAQ
jgi:hypothetical protein